MAHDAASHHIYMAKYNRETAHKYRRFHQLFDQSIPGQFYWHMNEAIRWIQVGKMHRKQHAEIQEKHHAAHT
jgi:hypothetical protein